MSSEKLEIENRIAAGGRAIDGVATLGPPTFFTCPDCHGAMVTLQDGTFRRFRCHTGHGFTEQSLLQHGSGMIERDLWSALSHLEERELLLSEMATTAQGLGRSDAAEYTKRAEQARLFASRVREIAENPWLATNGDDVSD